METFAGLVPVVAYAGPVAVRTVRMLFNLAVRQIPFQQAEHYGR